MFRDWHGPIRLSAAFIGELNPSPQQKYATRFEDAMVWGLWMVHSE